MDKASASLSPSPLVRAASSRTTNPVVVKGYKFFDSVTGDELYVRGVDYYPRPNSGDYNHNSVDFFTEEFRHVWERDIKFFKELGVNAVRLYAVDPSQDHDAFMCALSDAGIYVVVGMASSCKGCEITKEEAPKCYTPALKKRGMEIIDAFAKYPNTLAFSAGNEVNHAKLGEGPEWNGPCQKKFIRDMRAYIKGCDSIRHVPVGLVVADTDRADNAMYYNCNGDGDEDELENAEWFGLNTYVYCNGKAKTVSEALGFQTLLSSFRSYNYSIPVVLTEFGCQSDTFPDVGGFKNQRNFFQAKWLITEPSVRDLFTGGFAFEYSEEKQNANDFGIGYFTPDDCDDVDTPCEYNPTPAFYNLRNAYTGAKSSYLANETVLEKVNETKTSLRSALAPAHRASDADEPDKLLTAMDQFEPSPSRTGRSPCPDRFPPLDSFVWEADTVHIDHTCPSKFNQDFSCPGGAGSAPEAAQKSMMFCFGAGAVILALAAFCFFVGMGRGGVRRSEADEEEEQYSLEREAEGRYHLCKGSNHRTDSSCSSGEDSPLVVPSEVELGKGAETGAEDGGYEYGATGDIKG